MKERPAENMVRLATSLTPTQAHMMQNALEEEGIRCHVVGEFLEAGIGNVPGLGAELWVHVDDANKAQEILAQHRQAGEEMRAEEDEEE